VTVFPLQYLVLPAPDPGSAGAVYFHSTGQVMRMPDEPALHLGPGAQLRLDSYFNLFSYGKWRTLCDLQSLVLQLSGQGTAMLEVICEGADGSKGLLYTGPVDLDAGTDIALPPPEDAYADGVIYVVLSAGQVPVVLRGAIFATTDAPRRIPRLALCITTFRREAAVRRTAGRIARFLDRSVFGDQMHLFVVDNGDSAALPEHPGISRIVNANLGGAGGFARGLLEAEAAGFSHVVFMDDDAAIHMEAIQRTYALLAMAHDANLAVAGAMVTTREPWRTWEVGARFDGRCRPQFSGVDLRLPDEVIALEIDSNRTACETTYGGWWFFAFSVASVMRYPFPFFVRGDDVNFSLANPFRIVTLNGVISVAEDFTDKESPLTWYLDLRSHMVHHMTLEKMERGALGVARIGVWFFLRNLVRFQYDTLAAILLAWEDVMRGPGFFDEHADMARRRTQIKALARTEEWRPLTMLDMKERVRFQAATGWKRHFFRVMGNGHLLPFFALWGNRVVVPPDQRAGYGLVWGAARITYLNTAGDMGFQTVHSKGRFLYLSARMIWILLRFLWRYRALRTAYRHAYPKMASVAFWRQKLGLVPLRGDKTHEA